MTEAEWLACQKVTVPVMNWLRRKGTNRQFYLAGCAAVRHAWTGPGEPRYRELIELVERHADGQASSAELGSRHRVLGAAVMDQCQELEMRGRTLAQASKALAAEFAAVHAAMPEGGWEAGYSAMVAAARVGRRADQWAWQCAMLRDIFGNPFKPAKLDPAWLRWNDAAIPRIAQAIYDERDFSSLPVLADALEEAGCTNPDILTHCRQPGEHVRGCWVVDLILSKDR